MKFHVKNVKESIKNDNITIVAATKYFTPIEMRDLYAEGIHHFGENRDDAFIQKYDQLDDLNITWHFIGTLQTKKVKKIIDKIDYLHSLDNMKLVEEINKRRTKPLKCFLQVNISNEDTKHGLEINEVIPFIQAVKPYPMIEIIGLMGMAAFTNETKIIHQQFQQLNDLLIDIQKQTGILLTELSIGMSNDYLIAIEHHATFLRLGSVLFSKEV